MKILFSAAFILLASTSAFAAENPKKEEGMVKHCQSMMSDPKMADGMSRSMMDQCHELLKGQETSGSPAADHSAPSANHSTHEAPAGHPHP